MTVVVSLFSGSVRESRQAGGQTELVGAGSKELDALLNLIGRWNEL